MDASCQDFSEAVCCSVLQCVAVCCSVLQYVMTVSTGNATPPSSTKSGNSNSSEQTQMQSQSQFEVHMSLSRNTHGWVISHSCICVTWSIHVWHDSFICVTWFIHMCDITHSDAKHLHHIRGCVWHLHLWMNACDIQTRLIYRSDSFFIILGEYYSRWVVILN